MTVKKTKDTMHRSIWIASREYDGLAGAGGVKDVTRQMAETMAAMGMNVNVVLPCYGFMAPGELGFQPTEITFQVDMPYTSEYRREEVNVWHRAIGKEGHLYLLASPRFSEKKDVYTYTPEEEKGEPRRCQGAGHIDYFAMNALHQKGTLSLIIHLRATPDILHCHDGHTALIPAMARELEGFRQYFRNTGCVVTIHNAGHGYHQELRDLPFARAMTSLPPTVIGENLLDGSFDPLLAGSAYAVMNTVSENYARELRETYADELSGWLGHRLMARGVQLEGITNGIDPEAFNTAAPETLGLAAGFSVAKGDFVGKRICRQDLLARIAGEGFTQVRREGSVNPENPGPLFTFIGRFTHQKGIGILTEALEILLREDQTFQVCILGNGLKEIETNVARLAMKQESRGRMCALIGYDPTVANKVYAASDFFLVPSLFEPCGLTDYIAQLFGALPIVHHVGGLVKVIDNETGFAFQEPTGAALVAAMRRAMRLFREEPEIIRKMQTTAVARIKEQFTWEKVVKRYLLLYEQARELIGQGATHS